MKVNIDTNKIMNRFGLGKSKQAQEFMASELARLCDPYVPFQTGTLKNSVRVEPDKIIYPGPYAHYQYYGEVMAGRGQKHYTGKSISYHDAPMRGKEWEKRMLADRKGELVDKIDKFLKGR